MNIFLSVSASIVLVETLFVLAVSMTIVEYVPDDDMISPLALPAIGVYSVPHYGACRRCREPHVLIRSVQIRYPSTDRHIPLCKQCENEIMNVIDQALIGAGV